MERLIRIQQRTFNQDIAETGYGVYEYITALVWAGSTAFLALSMVVLLVQSIRYHYHAYIQTGKMPGLFDFEHRHVNTSSEPIPGVAMGLATVPIVMTLALFFGTIALSIVSHFWPFAIVLGLGSGVRLMIQQAAKKQRFAHCLKHPWSKS